MKLLFEISKEGRGCAILPECDVPLVQFDKSVLRESAPRLPEISETDLSRHYTELAGETYGVNNGFYPLGSCTMKYNPKVNEALAALEGFTDIHPLQPKETVQGALRVMKLVQDYLNEICGMDETTLQPAAGAHGEYTGLLLIRAYHQTKGDTGRTKIIVPDSAHGTNPASAAMAGFDVVSVPSNEKGGVDLEALKAAVGPDTAGLMLTNPNTLGLFDPNILEITKIIHEAGGLCYYDGANLNAVMGRVRPGDMGFDCVHVNLHKTFSTPHGGGGPGSGPVGCKEFLAEFLPGPIVKEVIIGDSGDSFACGKLKQATCADDNISSETGVNHVRFETDNVDISADTSESGCFIEKSNTGSSVTDDIKYKFYTPAKSIGRVQGFYGNFLVVVKALAYMLTLGKEGIPEASAQAVLNANYLMSKLKGGYDVAQDEICMHEFVLTLEALKKETGVSAMDVAKRLLDFKIHPPTMYFPLIVHEALMLEPTETESIETLDAAADMFLKILEEAKENPDILHSAPNDCSIGRPDEVTAARSPKVRYSFN